MVAICGYFGWHEASLKKMSSTMEYKGLSTEFYRDEYFGAAVRSKRKGEKSAFDPKGNILALFDGEIYNKIDLVEFLGNNRQTLSTISNAELFASLFERQERIFPDEFRGKFSAVVFNQEAKKIVLVRDRFGECPMYYAFFNDSLLFSSEIRSILKCEEIDREIDPVALKYYLSFGHVPAPRTIFKGIYKLPPACILESFLNGARTSTTQYWDLTALNEPDALKEEIWIPDIYKRIMNNVKIRSKGTENVGVLLSGGLDSGTVAAFLKKTLGENITAFSMIYENPFQNEIRNIEKIVQHLNLNHRTKVIESDDINEELIREIVGLYGEPCANSSVVPSYFASSFSSKYVPVVFTGDGGDEAFLGYSSLYWKEPRLLRYYSQLILVKKLAALLTMPILERLANASDDRRFAIALDFFERKSMSDPDPQIRFAARVLARFFSPEDLGKLDFTSGIESDAYDLVKDVFRKASNSLITKEVYAIMNLNLVADTCKAERSSTAFSLKIRSPFLDHKFMKFALSIPFSIKFKNNITKYVLRKMLLTYQMLPREIIKSQSKRGFEAPVEDWLKKDLKGLVYMKLLEDKPPILNNFNRQYIEKLITRKDRYSALKVWNLLFLSIWYDVFIREQRL